MLEKVDLSRELSKEQAEPKLKKLQEPAVLMFEGWDASGKGGAIKRLTQVLDPRGYTVVPIAAPQGDEKQHHICGASGSTCPRRGTSPSSIAAGTAG